MDLNANSIFEDRRDVEKYLNERLKVYPEGSSRYKLIESVLKSSKRLPNKTFISKYNKIPSDDCGLDNVSFMTHAYLEKQAYVFIAKNLDFSDTRGLTRLIGKLREKWIK